MSPQAQNACITASNTVPNGLGYFFMCPIPQMMPMQQVLPINPQFRVLQSNQNSKSTLYNNLNMANNCFGFNNGLNNKSME